MGYLQEQCAGSGHDIKHPKLIAVIACAFPAPVLPLQMHIALHAQLWTLEPEYLKITCILFQIGICQLFGCWGQ